MKTPLGVCTLCGVPIWGDNEHDHRKIGTLAPEEAAASWQIKLVTEQAEAARAEEFIAKEPRQ